MEYCTLKKLEENTETPTLRPDMVAFYRRLLRIQAEAESQTGVVQVRVSRPIMSKRHKAGLPMLIFDDIRLDWDLVEKVFGNVVSVFVDYPQLFNGIPDGLRRIDTPLLEDAARTWFTDRNLHIELPSGISEQLLQDVIKLTLMPLLISCSKALRGEIDQERWRRNCCPICGGSPDFAFLDKASGARWLVCSRCDTRWLFQRLECPHCGVQDQNALSYFTDDKGLYRLYVCYRCKHYLKTIDLRRSKEELDIAIERLYTLDLDIQAYQKGFVPVGTPA